MKTKELILLLAHLSQERQVFYSEADFQHALAWEIQKEYPTLAIHLEYKPQNIKKRILLDIYFKNRHKNCAIELKYKTRAMKHQHMGEKYDLLDQSAQDDGRYDFLKDIQRLEKVVRSQGNTDGYAILLTNDSSYWKLSKKDTVDSDFRLHEGTSIHGSLRWGTKASAGTKHGREDPIMIKGSYKISWRNYSILNDSSYGTFRYLLIKIKSAQS